MAEPFLSEIRLFSFNFPPKGWAFCNGQLLPINQNQALFALLGTTYGGNGQTNFALPNLQGRCAMHKGQGLTLGQAAGESAHTLTMNEMPTHTHFFQAANQDGANPIPTGSLLANFNNGYGGASNLTTLLNGTIGNAGGSQAHNNMAPYLTLNFCIALQGIFPSPN
ncbi:MAG TPA: tail fiber protein [Allosphingosinicella sp.]|jgi:microcystin-dependent protein